MHGPIEAEISRSSKISPSTAGLYHRSVIRLTIWLPVLAWMAMIMWFSTGGWSAENTGSILRPLLDWLLPWASAAHIAALHALIRKTAHVTEYGVLAALWFIALTRERRWSSRRAAWLAILVAIAWASLDELHQATVPSRTPSVGDVGFDAAGAVVAASLARVGWRQAIRRLTTALLWTAAAGGTVIIAVNLASGVGSGALWITVPLAAALLVLRWRRRGAAKPI
jgi:VanZ family protein